MSREWHCVSGIVDLLERGAGRLSSSLTKSLVGGADQPVCRNFKRADERIRTADPFITSEVLYQLSYVGGLANASASR